MRTGRGALLLTVLLALAGSGCTKPIDLKQALQITDATSGWFDAGVVDGKNKLVPAVTFRLRKTGDADIASVSLNALFRAADGAESSLDNDMFVQNVAFESAQTAPIVIRSENGYTADPPQSRADMLKHSQFRDMRVQVFVKHGASQWIDLGGIDVRRTLLTQ
jgi:hypothetical protein